VESSYKPQPNTKLIEAHTTFLQARVRHEFGNLDDAAKLAEAAVRLDPKSSAYHDERGEAYGGNQAERMSVCKQLARTLLPKAGSLPKKIFGRNQGKGSGLSAD
jgi:hypothetical protein